MYVPCISIRLYSELSSNRGQTKKGSIVPRINKDACCQKRKRNRRSLHLITVRVVTQEIHVVLLKRGSASCSLVR